MYTPHLNDTEFQLLNHKNNHIHYILQFIYILDKKFRDCNKNPYIF